MSEWIKKLRALDDVHLLALDVFAEAADQPLDGQIGAAWAPKNRVEHPGWWGHDYHSVILCPEQLSWVMEGGENHERVAAAIDDIPANFLDLAAGVISGRISSTVDGATNYFNPEKCWPEWADRMAFVRQIADHRFYRPR